MNRRVFIVLATSLSLSGCGFLGIYRYQPAERALPEEAAGVRFPDSFEKGDHFSGPKVAAIKVAMDEFMPPGTRARGDNQKLAECLSRWDTYDISVLQATDELFFVRFFPVISRCGLDDIVLDAGGVYAVDARGRIVAME